MKFLNYMVVNEGMRERVAHEDCDATEQAGIIDRTLLPVLNTGQGWAALRHDVPEIALPLWIDWWAKHAGYALMTREGW